MNRLWKIALPAAVLGAAVLGARAMLASPPEPDRRPEAPAVRAVEAVRIVPTDLPVTLESRGTVRPALRTTLVPEVAGTVLELGPAFAVGAAFREGETLLTIDPRDYEIALTRAAANVAQAEAGRAEQRALAEQARADWASLGRRGEPSALTLREPQFAAAEASLDAARAELERARLDLERTVLLAPYDGRVLERSVDPGQFVARGTPVGAVHASAAVEVALPLARAEVEFLALPDAVPAAAGAGADPASLPVVALEAALGRTVHRWAGRLVRVEGIDAATQQTVTVARVEDPFADPAAPLRVGTFVEASVEGRALRGVAVVPRGALRGEREVLVLDEAAGTVARRAVEVLRVDGERVAIGDGLAAGEVVVTTPLATIADGTPVRAAIDGAPAPPDAVAPSGGAGDEVDADADARSGDDGGVADANRG